MILRLFDIFPTNFLTNLRSIKFLEHPYPNPTLTLTVGQGIPPLKIVICVLTNRLYITYSTQVVNLTTGIDPAESSKTMDSRQFVVPPGSLFELHATAPGDAFFRYYDDPVQPTRPPVPNRLARCK